MSSIITDTVDIATRMNRWQPPGRIYSSKDVPDWELLTVHAIRLADAADDLMRRNRIFAAMLAKINRIVTGEQRISDDYIKDLEFIGHLASRAPLPCRLEGDDELTSLERDLFLEHPHDRSLQHPR